MIMASAMQQLESQQQPSASSNRRPAPHVVAAQETARQAAERARRLIAGLEKISTPTPKLDYKD